MRTQEVELHFRSHYRCPASFRELLRVRCAARRAATSAPANHHVDSTPGRRTPTGRLPRAQYEVSSGLAPATCPCLRRCQDRRRSRRKCSAKKWLPASSSDLRQIYRREPPCRVRTLPCPERTLRHLRFLVPLARSEIRLCHSHYTYRCFARALHASPNALKIAIENLFSVTRHSGCHCTDKLNPGAESTLNASISPSSATASTAAPFASRSMPCACREFTITESASGQLPQQATLHQGHRMRGTVLLVEWIVLVLEMIMVARNVRHVLVQTDHPVRRSVPGDRDKQPATARPVPARGARVAVSAHPGAGRGSRPSPAPCRRNDAARRSSSSPVRVMPSTRSRMSSISISSAIDGTIIGIASAPSISAFRYFSPATCDGCGSRIRRSEGTAMMGLEVMIDQASARFPKNLIVAYNRVIPPRIDIQGDNPKPPGIVPMASATPPTVSA